MNPQIVFGALVCFIVAIISFTNGFYLQRGTVLTKLGISLGSFIGGYVVLGIIGLIIWLIAWFGILIRDVVLWVIEAILFVPLFVHS